jgi:hypothetical protein
MELVWPDICSVIKVVLRNKKAPGRSAGHVTNQQRYGLSLQLCFFASKVTKEIMML